MKKNYMTPAVKVAMVKAPQILAGSPTPQVDTTQSSNTMDSKKGSLADFDDEEEDF